MSDKESGVGKVIPFYYYKYNDTPDGNDCFKKVFVLSKYAAMAAMGISFYDILYISHPRGYVPTLGRVCFWAAPFVGMAAIFASTTCAATTIRGKDDVLNYGLGGALAGSVIGTAWKNPRIGLAWAAGLACAAMLHKSVMLHGWRYITPEQTRRDFGGARKHDFTFRKDVDIPKTWW